MRRPRPRNLGIVCACLILLAAGVVTGVRWAQDKGPLTLLANWSGEEEKQFKDVLERFKDDHGIEVVYQGSSALSQVLAAGIASGSPPDVAVVPGPGELMTYADEGRLHPLGALFEAGRYDEFWAPEVTPQEGRKSRYWLPVKAGLKSMVWHSKSNEEKVAEFARTPGKWCLAMESGATSGWPGTDWVEDILLQQAGPKTYGDWATGKLDWRKGHVRKAWQTWGEMVGADDQDSMEKGLKADYTKTCSPQLLEHQGSFRATDWKKADGDFVHSAEVIPEARKAAKSWEASGDLAVMLNKSEEAEQLIRYLASPETELPEYTVNTGASPPIDTKTVKGRVASTLRGLDGTLCWDASDAMPRALRDAFQQAVLRYLIAPKTLDAELAALERLRVDQGTTLPVCS
ncbi:ABC transporter substrate-binding protein [Streptomyces sp. GQFP]|uniref:ABC transporter substrate-binding protein n=1 Tax=Streptomyces sp. GQFP TaxID=2907545 RepID=UPI001F274450|nr:ABC transporter substrate-binding protein [Streptomyces sp. GQFP]UIX30098.1 ABC transporter substrate-binding protein [Streptomyces sp. GQFP]